MLICNILFKDQGNDVVVDNQLHDANDSLHVPRVLQGQGILTGEAVENLLYQSHGSLHRVLLQEGLLKYIYLTCQSIIVIRLMYLFGTKRLYVFSCSNKKGNYMFRHI